jgi:truncated hemoglobin YjbI
MAEPSLYERLGGVFAIAAVIDHFSDAVVQNPIVGQASKNPELREWHTDELDRLPGLKFMRTLWVCNVAGGPFSFTATKPGSTPLGLEEAHRDLHISPAEFDEVAAELGRTLDHFGVPARERMKSWGPSRRTKGKSPRDRWRRPRRLRSSDRIPCRGRSGVVLRNGASQRRGSIRT